MKISSSPLTKGKFDKGFDSGPIVICVLDAKLMSVYLEILNLLREAGINSEIYLGKKDLKSQLIYSDKRRSPAVILIGENEIKNNEIKVKDLKKRKEFTTNRAELTDELKKFIPKNTYYN